jgi:hypothetical protein
VPLTDEVEPPASDSDSELADDADSADDDDSGSMSVMQGGKKEGTDTE